MKAMDIVVADSVEGVEALRTVWAGFVVPDIDADIDFFLAVVKAMKAPARPHVIHIRETDGHEMLVVARIEKYRLPFKLGYFTLGHAPLRALVVSFDGILGARGRAEEQIAIAELRTALVRGEADVVIMRNLDVAGDRLAAAQEMVPWFARGHGQIASRRWIADLPNSLEEFLARRSATTRSTLRREERGFLKRFDGLVTLRRFEHAEDLAEVTRDMVTVAARSYQHSLGAAFAGSPFDTALLRVGLEKGWTRVWVLYLSQRPVAFWSGTAYGKTFATGTPGFDPEFTKDRVGRYTMFRMIEDLCKDPAVSILDFGQGEAVYKSRFGHPLRLEREIMLSAMRPWPLLVVWIHSLFSLVNGLARKLASSNGWLGRLKTIWRKRGSADAGDAEVTP